MGGGCSIGLDLDPIGTGSACESELAPRITSDLRIAEVAVAVGATDWGTACLRHPLAIPSEIPNLPKPGMAGGDGAHLGGSLRFL